VRQFCCVLDRALQQAVVLRVHTLVEDGLFNVCAVVSQHADVSARPPDLINYSAASQTLFRPGCGSDSQICISKRVKHSSKSYYYTKLKFQCMHAAHDVLG
jgi:hypothetical protein